MVDAQLEKDLQFFKKNKTEYLRVYEGKYLLIKNHTLIGSFDNEEAAYKTSLEKFGNEPILIKQVLKNEDTVSISSLYFITANASL